MEEQKKAKIALIIFLVVGAILLTYNYMLLTYYPYEQSVQSMCNEIINHTALSPLRYRILLPTLIHIGENVFQHISANNAFMFAYIGVVFCCYLFSLSSAFYLFKQFHENKNSIILLLLFTVSLVVAQKNNFFQPWSILEPGLYTLGIVMAIKKRIFPFIVITILAVLNRETGIFLSAAYILAQNSVMDYLKKITLIFSEKMAILTMIIAVAIYALLRMSFGDAADEITVQDVMKQNLQPFSMIILAINIATYFHLYLILGLKWNLVPDVLKRMWPIVLLCSFFIAVYGIWYEIRMFNSVLPLLLCVLGFGLNTLVAEKENCFVGR